METHDKYTHLYHEALDAYKDAILTQYYIVRDGPESLFQQLKWKLAACDEDADEISDARDLADQVSVSTFNHGDAFSMRIIGMPTCSSRFTDVFRRSMLLRPGTIVRLKDLKYEWSAAGTLNVDAKMEISESERWCSWSTLQTLALIVSVLAMLFHFGMGFYSPNTSARDIGVYVREWVFNSLHHNVTG